MFNPTDGLFDYDDSKNKKDRIEPSKDPEIFRNQVIAGHIPNDELYRIYHIRNLDKNTISKFGIASIVDPDDRKDPFCFNNRIRALSQSGASMEVCSAIICSESLVDRRYLEKQLHQFVKTHGYKCLFDDTKQAGHTEWFYMSRSNGEQMLTDFYTMQYLKVQSFISKYQVFLLTNKVYW